MKPIRPNPTLSDDLISEILVRVPVKSLIQFQLVSKTWLSLIKDPVFVKAQLRRAIRSGSDETLMLVRYSCSTSTESAKLKLSLFDVDSRQIVSETRYPYSQGESRSVPRLTLVGSANGIVCLVLFETSHLINRFFLWNPATRQSLIVVPGRGLSKPRALGFGYDPVDEDYKIVRVVSGPCLPAEVFSANRNVWREVPDPIDSPDDFLSGHFNVCVNGFLCGIDKGVGMMVFDLNKEVMNCAIKLPVVAAGGVGVVGDNDDDYDEEYYDAQPETHIIELDKSIAVITLWADALNGDRTGGRLNKKINMWMLDDDACLKGGGVEASWTIMFSIDLAMPAVLYNGYFSNGELLLLIRNHDDRMWISCDADKKEAKIARVEMADHLYTHRLARYTESLVSLPGFKQIKDWNGRDDDDN
ncbi:putative F-box protein At3g10240 [Daucus carota subsp. sativus]|uniref:putative F-box protein At3g10240 n=1 Tax=Daucus carota subsp. sativus TaxID=79200 RepID=UPI003083A709